MYFPTTNLSHDSFFLTSSHIDTMRAMYLWARVRVRVKARRRVRFWVVVVVVVVVVMVVVAVVMVMVVAVVVAVVVTYGAWFDALRSTSSPTRTMPASLITRAW